MTPRLVERCSKHGSNAGCGRKVHYVQREESATALSIAYRSRRHTACYTENRIRPPDEPVWLPNLLTPKGLFGENQEASWAERSTNRIRRQHATSLGGICSGAPKPSMCLLRNDAHETHQGARYPAVTLSRLITAGSAYHCARMHQVQSSLGGRRAALPKHNGCHLGP